METQHIGLNKAYTNRSYSCTLPKDILNETASPGSEEPLAWLEKQLKSKAQREKNINNSGQTRVLFQLEAQK